MNSYAGRFIQEALHRGLSVFMVLSMLLGAVGVPTGVVRAAAARTAYNDSDHPHHSQSNILAEITESDPVAVAMDEDGSPTGFDLTLHVTESEEGETFTWSISTPASNGVATASGTGTAKDISYTPNANFNGSDSFVVQVSNGTWTDTITVNVTINPVNDAPVCLPISQTTAENTPSEFDPDCSDVDGPSLTYEIVTPAQNGTASVSAGRLNYSPVTDYSGSDTFTYRASDGSQYSDGALVSITITQLAVCYPLTLTHTGIGATPVADPVKSASCTTDGEYVVDELIQLSGATAAAGWQINGWTGSDSDISTADTNTVTMPAGAHTTSVTYIPIEYTVNVAIVGNGTVTKDPDRDVYYFGETVQLLASPASGWHFSEWSGDATGLSSPVVITIDGDKNVTATFAENPFTCSGALHVDADSIAATPDGCSWDSAFQTLQDALAVAPMRGSVIWVAEGTYYPDEGAGQTNDDRNSSFWLADGVSIYGGFVGTETLLDQRDTVAHVTILSGDIDQVTGNANNAYHVVIAAVVSSSAVLDGFTIQDGYANSDGLGGGFYNENGSPTLRNLTITNNASTNFGGGMYSTSSTATDSSIASPMLTNVTFTGNRAPRGGGLVTMNSNAILTDIVFANNTATGGAGGGMNNQTASSNDPASVPVLTNVTFKNNTANGGGALFNGNSNAILTNVTMTGNTGNIRGGGILNEGSSPVLTNVTISGNTAPDGFGGAIRNVVGVAPANKESNPTIQDSILWGNSAGGGADEITADDAGFTTISNSVVENGCQPAGSDCASIVIDDPVLGALADNGGFTQTMALGVGSYAIDAGDNATCATTDQRGVARPQGLACDAGAYEYEAGTLTTLTVSPVTGEYAGTATLTATLDNGGVGIGGRAINFTLNGASVGSANTGANGLATLSNVSLAGIERGTYPSAVAASFAGDGTYVGSNGSAELTVTKATPLITWANPADMLQGTPLGATQLNATAPISGTFVYNPPAGTILNVGNGQTLSVDFTPDDADNYNGASANVTINVYVCYILTLGHTGQGTDPVADPVYSAGCSAGSYRANEPIQLSGATPATGWHITGWTGTSDDPSIANTNSLTMPASDHQATVDYARNVVTLTVNVTGSGTVDQVPAGSYLYGDEVTLTAVPATDWHFDHWEVDLTGTTNPETITLNGNKSVTAVFVLDTITHSVALVSGWNLVSFNVHPVDTGIASVLASITGNYDLVYAWDATGSHAGSGNWLKYDNIPYSPDTLTALDETMGFWIHMTGADTLEIAGTAPDSTNISLLDDAGGWNLVAYPSAANRTLPDVLVDHGVGTDFTLIYAYHANEAVDAWKLFDRNAPPFTNDLTQLTPGWGYWIKMTADHTWTVSYAAP